MTVMPIYKICPKCHKKYLWDPDTGRMGCPECGRTERRKALEILLKGMIGGRKRR